MTVKENNYLYKNKLLWIAIIFDFLIQLLVAAIIINSDFFTPDKDTSASYIFPIIVVLVVFPIIGMFSICWNVFQAGIIFYFIYVCTKSNFYATKDSNGKNWLSGLLLVLYVPLVIYKLIFFCILIGNGISNDSYKIVFPEKQGIVIDALYDKE